MRLIRQGLVWMLTLMAAQASAMGEAALPEAYPAVLDPLLARSEGGELGLGGGGEGRFLSYGVFRQGEAPRPAIMLLPGYSESWLKYDEVIHDLLGAGFDVFIYDHRGMGLSSRLTADPLVAHVDRFEDYVDDAQRFLQEVVVPKARGPLHLLSHSTGGLVAAHLLARDPWRFRSVALNAPLFELNTGSIPEWLAYGITSFNVWRGAGRDYAPGRGHYDPKKQDPALCRTTHSAVRCGRHIAQQLARPGILVAGPSNQWVKEIIQATRRREELARAVGGVPILILQADEDFFVRAEGQEEYCRAAKNCRLIRVAGGYHELLQESDPQRSQAFEAIVAHFRRSS